MVSRKDSNKQRLKRHRRVRAAISGTPERPRLCVYRSLANIYCQVIDDEAGVTLASAGTVEKAFRAQKLAANVKSAEIVGQAVAERALAKGIKKVVFDRGGFPYHGCVKAVADAARKAGLEF